MLPASATSLGFLVFSLHRRYHGIYLGSACQHVLPRLALRTDGNSATYRGYVRLRLFP